ncbi:MAG: S8 family serine peptidase [bacterium]|jgi:hypothetical protein|nr:S8 family serine peptidase [bacterium]
MKRHVYALLFLLLAGRLLSAAAAYHENHILFSLPPEREPFTAEECASMQTPDPELNKLILKFNAVRLEPWISDARPDEHDGDLYLNRIYRLVLSPDKPASPQMAEEFKRSVPSLAHAELEPIMRKFAFPDDPGFEYQWFLRKTQALEAWDLWDTASGEMPGSRRIVVAVVDDGVEYTHPDLWQNIWINQDEIPDGYLALIDTSGDGWATAEEALGFAEDYNGDGKTNLRDVIAALSDGADNDGDGAVDNIIGWDTDANDGNSDDDNNPMPVNNSHGTHVSGLVGAVSNNGIGVASVASRVSIMPIKATGDADTNNISTGWDGILHAARAGADIINCSWGGPVYSSYAQGIINTVYNTYGALIVAAAGNGDDEGNPSDEYHYPSGYNHVISVTAVSSQDRFSWANYGAADPANNFYGVDIAAPGENMYSTYLTKLSPYASLMGTSMASPLVASCLALIKSVYPDSSNEWLTARLLEHADSIDDINPSYAGQLGSGRVNILKSLVYDQWPSLSYSDYIGNIEAGDADTVLNPGERYRFHVKLQNAAGWMEAAAPNAVLRTAHSGISIIDSVGTWNNIPQDTGSYNSDDGFLVEFLPQLLTGEYTFELQLKANESSEKLYRKSLSFTIPVSLDQQGFPFITGNSVEISPLFADLDGDGYKDIIFADKSGNIYALDHEGSVRDGFPVQTGSTVGGLALADLNGNGDPEIICTLFDKQVRAYDIGGALVWKRNVGGFVTATPAVGNVDADPEPEIVFGAYDKKIYVLNHDSTDVAGFPRACGQNIRSGVALADLNTDGRDEIVFGGLGGTLDIIDADGNSLSGWPQTTSGGIDSEPQVVFNSNGNAVILVANDLGDMYAYDTDATLRFRIDGIGGIKASPAIFTQDQKLYAAYGTTSGNLYLLDVMNGLTAPGWPIQISPVYHSLAVADVGTENSGARHILIIGNDGRIRAYDTRAQQLPGFPVNTRYLSKSGLAITDIDNDGDNEMISGIYPGITVIDLKGSAGEIAWPMHRGNTQRSGAVSLIYSALAETDLPDFDIQLIGNYPNPFNPLTSISYRVSRQDPVELRIFNLNGRQILRKTILEPQPGKNEVHIDMSIYSSGIYLYSLNQNGRTQAGKMAFLK